MNWLLRLCCDPDANPPLRHPPQIRLISKPSSSIEQLSPKLHTPHTPINTPLPTPLPALRRDSSSLGELSRILKKDRY
jgi:hypothetical protein